MSDQLVDRGVAEGVLAAPDLELRSAVARTAAGQDLGAVWVTNATASP
jgi:hypothetical protein